MSTRRCSHLKHTSIVFQRSIDHDEIVELIDEPTVFGDRIVAGGEEDMRILGNEKRDALLVDGSFSESPRRAALTLLERKRRELASPDLTCCKQSLSINRSQSNHPQTENRRRCRSRNRIAPPFWTLAVGADDMFALSTNSS